MILGITGHRSQNLGGFTLPNPIYNKICLLEFKPEKIITGMAQGYDLYVANIAFKLKIPFTAAVPFKNQERMWPKEAQQIYHKLLKRAEQVVIVSEGEYAAYKMQIRNEYIVDNSDQILACFIKTKTSGGTFNCIQYAKKQNKEIIVIDPSNSNM